MDEKILISKIAEIIAFHKKELISNIESLGYRITKQSDVDVINFITENIDADVRIAQVIANIILKYDQPSNFIGAIVEGVGGIVGGITGVFSEKEKVKGAKEETKKAQILLEAERLKLEQERVRASTKMSKGTIIAIFGGGVLFITIIVLIATRRKSVPVAQ